MLRVNSLCSGARRGQMMHFGVVDHADFKYDICLKGAGPDGGERAWPTAENGVNLYKTPHSVRDQSILIAPLESPISNAPWIRFSEKVNTRCTQVRKPNGELNGLATTLRSVGEPERLKLTVCHFVCYVSKH